MQNGAVPSTPVPFKHSQSNAGGYAMSGGYAVMLAHRDRVDYSVTKGGLRLWAVLFVFIVLCSSLYTVFSSKGIFDMAIDLDGDGDFDTDVDDGDDDEAIHAERRQEKEKELKETPTNSLGEKLSSLPDRQQSMRSKEGANNGEEEPEADEDVTEEFGEEEQKLEEEQDGEETTDGVDQEEDESDLADVEERMLKALKEKAAAKQRKQRRAVSKVEVEEETEEDVEESTTKGPTKVKTHEKKGTSPVTEKKHKVQEEELEEEEEAEKEEEKEPQKTMAHHSKGVKKWAKKPEKVEEEIEEVEKNEPLKVIVHHIKGAKKSPRKLEEVEEEVEEVKDKGEKEPIKIIVHHTKGVKIPARKVEEVEEEVEIEAEVDKEEKEPTKILVHHKKGVKNPRKVEKVEEEVEEEVDQEEKEPVKIIHHKKGVKNPRKVEKVEEELEEEVDQKQKEPVKVIHHTKGVKKPKKQKDLPEQVEERQDESEDENIKVRVFRRKGAPKQSCERIAEQKEKGREEEDDTADEQSKKTVKIYRTKGMQTKPVTISHRSEETEEQSCEAGGACEEESHGGPQKIRSFKTKGKIPAEELTRKDEEEKKEEDEEDEEESVPVTRRPPTADARKVHGSYKKHAITNREDNKIRSRLDDIDKLLDESHIEDGLLAVETLLKTYSKSPRGHYARARALDLQSEKRQSNKLLQEAIKEYDTVLSLSEVPDALFVLTGNRLVDRCRFRGWMQKALTAQKRLVERYPDDLDIRNDYGLAFLMMGRNDDAKNVFQNVLQIDPSDGYAKVHLGFILKTVDERYEEAIRYLSEGIQSNSTGTQDGRFYFHLGDALQRVGRNEEAYALYDKGVGEGLFLSRYQRSLYNVKGLTARPWWTPEQTNYQQYLKAIEKEWKTIRDEALDILDQSGIFNPEDEKLTNWGDWKQFTLFQRGKQITKNCAKVPKTCALMEKFPAAAGCTRGQIDDGVK